MIINHISKTDYSELFKEIEKRKNDFSTIIAIEGGSASGKTTLSEILKTKYNCAVFHMDDFFLRPEQRTKERLSEAGGNVDRERFEKEVLLPLSKNENVLYKKFDCSSKTILSPVEISKTRLCIVEGAYSMHPELQKYYSFSVFLDISPDTQKNRILKRNKPILQRRFFEEWIPMENKYFSEFDIKNKCNIVINVE